MYTTKRNTLVHDGLEKIEKLKKILNRHIDSNYFEEYEIIINGASKKLMSTNSNSSFYGMFFADENVIKYFWKKSYKLTTNEKKRDFVYYFDNQDRLMLSIMYNKNGGDRALRWYFFYYYPDHTEIIEYEPTEKLIAQVASIDYVDGILDSFVESLDIRLGLNSYEEYLFNLMPNRVIKKTYNNILESISELRKLH